MIATVKRLVEAIETIFDAFSGLVWFVIHSDDDTFLVVFWLTAVLELFVSSEGRNLSVNFRNN